MATAGGSDTPEPHTGHTPPPRPHRCDITHTLAPRFDPEGPWFSNRGSPPVVPDIALSPEKPTQVGNNLALSAVVKT